MNYVEKIRENHALILVVIYVLGVIVFCCSYSESLYIPVHDVLDSHIPAYKILCDTGMFFSQSGSVPYLGGINRDYCLPEFKVYSIAYVFLTPKVALVTYYLLRIIISVLGCIWLGKEVLKADYKAYKNAVVYCGLLYAILPVSPIWDIAVSIYPALGAILYKLYYKKWLMAYPLLFILPFFSELAHFGIFIIGYVVMFFFIDFIVYRIPKWRIVLGALLLSLGYIISEYRMFRLKFFSEEITLREKMVYGEVYSELSDLWTIVKQILNFWIHGQYHTATCHEFIVFPICIIALVYLGITLYREKKMKDYVSNPFVITMSIIFINCIVSTVDTNFLLRDVINSAFPLFRGIELERIVRVNTFLWYLAFSMVIIFLMKHNFKKLSYVIILLAFIPVLVYPSKYSFIGHNIKQQIDIITEKSNRKLSYDELYSCDLFEKIKNDIGYDNEWSIAYGMHPAILTYNQIHTLDGYHSWYSQAYKDQFRKIIAPELEVDASNKAYYDNWGGRAYIFSNEIEFEPTFKLSKQEANMLINPQVFKEMGGKYVFSRVSLLNATDLGFRLIGKYRDASSPYTIYVYSNE